uniref:Uncharacterized protein n=1 Tax=Kalanchoe fedtschenkoi TaxID=63787 RepID=A0A7N0UIY7_KALFE
MISARAAGRTTIVSLVTSRVELSQKVWYSSLSERASGISCKPPFCDSFSVAQVSGVLLDTTSAERLIRLGVSTRYGALSGIPCP